MSPESSVDTVLPSIPSDPPLLSVGRPYAELVGLELRLDDPASINDDHALPSQVGMSANIRSEGGPLLADDKGFYGSVTVFSDPAVPQVALLLFGSLQSIGDGSAGSPGTTVEISDVLEIAWSDREQTSVHHIGCFVENAVAPDIVAVIPIAATDDSRRVPAMHAWRYSRAGLETLDPDGIECELAGD